MTVHARSEETAAPAATAPLFVPSDSAILLRRSFASLFPSLVRWRGGKLPGISQWLSQSQAIALSLPLVLLEFV